MDFLQQRSLVTENLTTNKILVIIPAYNEAANIGGVISALRREVPHADIVVINDGSSDATGQVAAGLGIRVVKLPYNMGIGAAMQTGYMYAADKGYDIALQVDGDGQHPPNQIQKVISPVIEGRADIAIGSRFLGEGEYVPSLARSIGIKTFSRMLSVITRQKVTDPTSGFRAVNKDVIRFYARDYPEDYPEPEAIALLHKAGFRIAEVPIRMEARVWGKSSITYFRAFYYMVKVSLAVLIDLMKRVER